MTIALDKPVRRVVPIAGVDYVVELSRAGVSFRRPRARARAVAPIGAVLKLAEQFAAQDVKREQLRAAALRRMRR